MSESLLAAAERVLHAHSTASFDTTSHVFPECIEYVRAVEDEQAWKAAYWSLDAFYAAHGFGFGFDARKQKRDKQI